MLTEYQIQREIVESINKLFDSIKTVKITKIVTTSQEKRRRSELPDWWGPDLWVNIKTRNNKKYQLAFEIKSTGQPRMARMVANNLQKMISGYPNTYGVFGAPYISEDSQRLCKSVDIGFFDLAGNCYIKFDDIFISVEGKKNPYPATWSLKTLFSPKSSRALRALLSLPKRDWLTIELAKKAQISLGLASNVKKYLLENELAQEIREGKSRNFRLINPEQLLNKWSIEYSYQQNILYEYYSMDDIKVLERKLSEILPDSGIKYAFSLTSGASLVAPNLRYRRAFVYIDKDKINRAADLLKLKPVPSGANIVLMEPYDDGVFYGLQDIAGAKVVSDIQLYLDLRNYKERGEEAAVFILRERIKNRW